MSAVYGYVRAATVVNQNLTISEYSAQDKLASALSLTMIMKGVFVMTIGQFLGNASILKHLKNIISFITFITFEKSHPAR